MFGLFESRKDRQLRKVAEYLKHFPSCWACQVENQEDTCESIQARWAGREILRILDRPGWITKALDPVHEPAAIPLPLGPNPLEEFRTQYKAVEDEPSSFVADEMLKAYRAKH